jgi:hypothetical protein
MLHILLVEVRVNKMGEMLEETINATRTNVEHRQSQTLDEREVSELQTLLERALIFV